MDPGLLPLQRLTDSINPLGEDWNEFSGLFTPFSAKRKEQLTMAGEVERYLYFVVEGVQRVYYFDDQNHEATVVFTYAPSFGGVLDSLMLQTPSRYSYETLTASSFYRAKFSELNELRGRSHEVGALMNKGLAVAFSGVLERLTELQSCSSEEKFRKLLQRSPHILQLVPHKYLANYLGIDPANFSHFTPGPSP